MGRYRVVVKGIVNYGSDYLLLKKWYDDRIDEPYQWEFPNGEVEFGEMPERAAERIVLEDTGLTAEASKPLYTWQYTVGEVCTIGICYLLHAHTQETMISEEYCDSVWVNRFEFEDYITDARILKDIERADL
ncbi:MAG: NUDIX domain-containing protein [Lachnospiraceae bacterium]|nr:NUDIX domain-containing protein [Lachnospiraceae bacterium]